MVPSKILIWSFVGAGQLLVGVEGKHCYHRSPRVMGKQGCGHLPCPAGQSQTQILALVRVGGRVDLPCAGGEEMAAGGGGGGGSGLGVLVSLYVLYSY